MRWADAVGPLAARGEPYALATVLATSGSAPRDADGKMVVSATETHDSIGGGRLEALVTDAARELLTERRTSPEIRHFPLAATALQCCGGSVTVLIEPFATDHLDVALFGAGHVGRRVAALLDELPARLTWVDNRPGMLAAPGRARARELDDPVAALDAISPRTHALVLTHDHLLDYRLVSALLEQDRVASIGLIGSLTKWQRFRARLLADGFAAERVDRVRCPVGLDAVPGKQPMAVAISIVGELLALHGGGEAQVPAPSALADATPAAVDPDAAGTRDPGADAQETSPVPLTWRRIKLALIREDGE